MLCVLRPVICLSRVVLELVAVLVTDGSRTAVFVPHKAIALETVFTFVLGRWGVHRNNHQRGEETPNLPQFRTSHCPLFQLGLFQH